MKKTLLLKTMLLLCALVVGSSSVWADEVTYIFTSKSWEATLNGETANWTSGKDGYGFFSGQGIQVTKDVTGANATSPVSYPNISKIVVTYNTNASKGAGSIDIKIGDNTAKSNNVSYTTGTGSSANYTTEFTYDTPETGNVKITVNTTTNSIYPKSITITYTDASDTRQYVNMESFTADKTTLVVGETTNTTVTNDQSGWTASYTYTSDAEGVATVDEDGVITAVAKGSANITATLKIPSTDPNYKVGTVKSKSIAITVNKPSHNVVFSVNGITSSPESLEEDVAITFPEDPSDIGGKIFVGWVNEPIDGTTDVKPTIVNVKTAKMGTSDITYYAVFVTRTGSVKTYNDVLTRETTGIANNSSSYSEWSGKTSNSDAVYAGNSAGGNDAIQLRSNNSNSGIVTTASGGKVKKVVVEWYDGTADERILDIYGKNGAYSKATDLYNANNQGDKLGDIKKENSTEFEIDGNYTYIGLRSHSGAMYISSITITWEKGSYSYSDYCTTIPSPSVTITATGYTTFSCNSALDLSTISEGATAYVATEVADGMVKLQKTTAKVPAGTGLFIKGTANETYTIDMTSEATEEPASNLLVGAPNGTTVEKATEGFNYVFGWTEVSNPGFYLINSNSATLPAGKAYLHTTSELDAPAGSRLGIIFDDGEVTSIESVSGKLSDMSGDFFDLQGRKVANPTKGLYIVNGKKVVIK